MNKPSDQSEITAPAVTKGSLPTCHYAFPGLLGLCLTLFAALPASAHEVSGEATYLANEAVLVASGETKIMFDPLFDQGFNNYHLVPADTRLKIMTGAAPFDGIDAVFVSHAHGDHFTAEAMIAYLEAQPDVQLFAPAQAVTMMHDAHPEDTSIFDRITVIEIEQGSAPAHYEFEEISVDAVRTPHSGSYTNVANMVYRVTVKDGITVMHMGDSAVDEPSFSTHNDLWATRRTDHAFPPYWFMGNAPGHTILTEIINAETATFVHVPIRVPRRLSDSDADYFSTPGETRAITRPHKDADQ